MQETSSQQKHFPVSWGQLHRGSRALAWRLADRGEWSAIVCVTRGDLVQCAIVVRELNIRLIETVCITSYANQAQGRPDVIKRISDDFLMGNGGIE